ncbi:MAG: carboxypeptidase regulatory-like domain-containing protein [Gemmatimonadetes bacterium]|nr:carboxypeptidase regulatory-like domain-containing protein [Gemmatimonadota bacterium]
MRRIAAMLLLCAPLAARAQEPAPQAQPTGIIAGAVRDEAGRPVPQAVITVDGTARQTRSDTAGRFALERVPVGIQEITIRRIGFRPARAQLAVRPDSAMVIAVTMVADAQTLAGVRIEEQLLNQLSGVVIDEQGRPIAGAEVDVVGLRRAMVSDADGRFIFVDLAPGNYLLEVRKEGYGLARRAVQMVARIERDLAVRLYAGVDERTSLALARVVAAEMDRRKSFAGAQAAFVTRAELERWGEAPLINALMGSSGALAMRTLVDVPRDRRSARGPGSIDTRGTAGARSSIGAANAPTVSCVLVNGHEIASGDLLSFFRASEVELVEIFPVGSENSRTFCGRFPPSTGCNCPPDPAGLVVWLRK